MLKAFDFCIPTRGTKVPSAPDWLHEIKYDGYRLRVERNGESRAAYHPQRVRLDEPLSVDCRSRTQEPPEAIRDRWRGGHSRRRRRSRFQCPALAPA